MQQSVTPERFAALAAALAWDEERRWVLGARLVEGVPYRALAVQTGRTPGALADEVYRARQEIREHEERRADPWDDAGDLEAAELRRYAGLFGSALLCWDLSDHHFPLWACVMVAFSYSLYPSGRESRSGTESTSLELIAYKYARDAQFARGEAPPP